ncbi:MAG: hypothetical protein IMW90_07515 [Thermogemmatispora sp.]|jgi:hypothetical protein|uniref:DUF4878 domain-containing protein n=1 Tax=Thermogemmatispora aurantia TaxID=2045279 RepID=A0A5J4K309_9CHLR|nr:MULTISPECIES: hypothetical protein [Thermogemmatispora]MBE3565565.1 hypothetical protein [Thermogemmatispora sp.]GER81953.1 hypothetical protein KTAU_05910 [Thermogemmatispora aurantia]
MPGRRDRDEESQERYEEDFAEFEMANGANGHRYRSRRRSAGWRSPAAWPPPDDVDVEPEPPRRRKWRWWWLAIAALVICGICGFMGTFAAVNLGIGMSLSKDAAVTASNFLAALGTQDYAQAYRYLGPPMTLQPGAQSTFIAQAQHYDACFGTVVDYKQVEGTTVIQDNTWSSTYEVTRSKLQRSYRLTLTLQEDSNHQWRIVDYQSEGADNALAPSQPACQ